LRARRKTIRRVTRSTRSTREMTYAGGTCSSKEIKKFSPQSPRAKKLLEFSRKRSVTPPNRARSSLLGYPPRLEAAIGHLPTSRSPLSPSPFPANDIHPADDRPLRFVSPIRGCGPSRVIRERIPRACNHEYPPTS